MYALVCFLLVIYQTDPVLPGCTVYNCDPDNCNGNNCTQCLNGFYLYNDRCYECYLHCRSCNRECYRCGHSTCPTEMCAYANCPVVSCSSSQNIVCSSCPDGFYNSNGRCYRCFHYNCKCIDYDDCNGCVPGRYGSNYCYGICPSNCTTCKSSADCTECIAGTYGKICQFGCISTCQDGTCGKEAGTCLQGCAANQYLNAENVCRNCPNRCSSCTDYYTCTSCNNKPTYKWGSNCQYDCTACSNSGCSKIDGCSSGCDNYYYPTYNEIRKGYECTKCPSNCWTCTNGTHCTKCKDGYWGRLCNKTCGSGCATNACDQSQGCTIGCISGYYHKFYSNTYTCVECPQHCKLCPEPNKCHECEQGYHLGGGSTCVACSAHCKNKICNKNNGSCTNGCFGNSTGQRCDEWCFSNCLECSQFSASDCSTCEKGFYGPSCEVECSSNCNTENGNLTCEKAEGHCTYGCKNRYWGLHCNRSCAEGCIGSICNETTGECSQGCKSTYFGVNCETECSKTCASPTQEERVCDTVNGYCLAGCVAEFTGPYCDETTTDSEQETQTDQKTKDTDGDLAVPIGAGVGAAVVIIIIVVIVVLLLRRRRSSNKENIDATDVVVHKPNGLFGQEGNAYASIDDTRKIEPETMLLNESSPVVMTKPPVVISINQENIDNTSLKDSIKQANKESENQTNETNTDHQDFKNEEQQSPAIGKAETPKDNSEEPEDRSVKDNAMVEPTNHKMPTENVLQNNSLINADQKDNISAVALNNVKPDDKEAGTTETSELQQNEDENMEDHAYYNTVKKRIPVKDLENYVKNKSLRDIVNEFQELPQGLLKPYTAAKSPRNASKNRYKEIYPYDESRVILRDGGNDYFNASYIEGYNKPKEYIGSAGPFQRKDKSETSTDFWRMIWQEKCETIVMLTRCYEDTQHKCDQYWPDLGESQIYGQLQVTSVTEDQYSDFTVRAFLVSQGDDSLNIIHIQFTTWPDKGVPADVTTMIEYRQKVRSLHKNKTCPMLVHCSAGIGRTGTFITLDMLIFMGETRGCIDIFGCVSDLRRQRVNLVQTPDQYVYIHHAIVHALTFDCKSLSDEDFITHYSQLIKKKDGSSQIERQFKKLQCTTDDFTEAEKESIDRNKGLSDKNREGADIPADDNRVKLSKSAKPEDSDYINAVFINAFRLRNRFIVAQTPLPATIVDFLTMVYQSNCCSIVSMDDLDVHDKTVGVFWPTDKKIAKHGAFQVKCNESTSNQNYTLKKLSVIRRVGKKDEERNINLFIFTNWPSGAAVPLSSDSLLQLIADVDKANHRDEEERPIIIHCMTGAERSCLFCAVSILVEKMAIEHEVSVVNTLRQVKARRRSAIPSLDQYKFSHQAIISYLQTFDIYSNFGLKTAGAGKTESDVVYATVNKNKNTS